MPRDNRFRNFTCILYPDSAGSEDEVYRKINAYHIPAFLSPLHEGDPHSPEFEGKPHWHLMFMFPGKKAPEDVFEIFDCLKGVRPEIVQSVGGMARYLCHLDEHDKNKYSPSDVKCFAGADYTEMCTTQADLVNAMQGIISYIDYYKIMFYHQLLKQLLNDHEDYLFRMCCFSCSAPVKEYLRSKWTKQKGE